MRDPEKSHSTALHVIRMIINEKDLNQSSMASLLVRKTEPKVVVKFDSSAKFIFIPTFGHALLCIKFYLTSWLQTFSFIIILFTCEAVLSDFSGSLKCILNISQNLKKIEYFLKVSELFFFKIFFHNHYLQIMLYWFTKNDYVQCGGWSFGMKSIVLNISFWALYTKINVVYISE